MEKDIQLNQGVIRCSYYAFMPNRLSFCGPDKNKDLFNYCVENQVDKGLQLILSKFQTLYPYLHFIAWSNKIRDPFNEKVVEAYWIGNELLENISKNSLYRHLTDNLRINKKIKPKSYQQVKTRIALGARPHHNFHVLNIWRRIGNQDIERALSSMDLCRISWGRVVKVNKSSLRVSYQPLILENNDLILGKEIVQEVAYQIDKKGFINQIQEGDWISMHWGFACEVLSGLQVAYLKKYTEENIRLVNC